MLLSIDTSAGTSVAVVDSASGVCVERSVQDTRRHAEVIGDLIAECLAAAGLGLGTRAATRLTGVAVGMGPGPFTGLRVGIAAATAFALGAERPILRVASHDAVAFGHYRSGGVGPLLVTTDARRHERYWTFYSSADDRCVPQRTHGPGLGRAEDIDRTLTESDTDLGGYHRIDADWVSAVSVAMLAESLLEGGLSATGGPAEGGGFATAEPLYLRSPDVTLATAPKRVSS